VNLFRLRFLVLASLITSLALLPSQLASAQERSAPERVAADTPRVSPGGASFKVPAQWSIVTGKDIVILEAPEPDTHIVIFDAQANDAASAVNAAWAAYKPNSKRPVKLVTPQPAKEGWD